MTRLMLFALAIASVAFGQEGVLPAEVRLGARVEAVRRQWPVAKMVVVADSASAYAEAISEWSLERRFPVLLDNGTDAAREDIARFVRAFGAERVRLFSGTGVYEDGVTEEAVENAAAQAWDVVDVERLHERWEEMGFEPPGVVVADVGDAAWTAALALAAGRGQAVVWVDAPEGRVGSRLDVGAQRKLLDSIEAGVRGFEWEWGGLGDAIDSVTVCLNAPTKGTGAEDEKLALTDVIGRSAAGKRWAWCGMVVGNESEAAYRAMCSLFLQPKRAWLFNGYSRGGAFAAYTMEPAAEIFEGAGMELLRTGRPAGGRADWALEAMAGVDAGLVFVNTSGTRRRFDVAPGRAYGVDVPLLEVPSAVHFIHSFSTQNLDDRDSIARAWLDQGAFSYVGSVDEPYLSAFVTPGVLARRLVAPAPIGAAARTTGEAWKVNVLGDPLYALGPDAPVFAGGVDFEGLRSAESALRAALAGRYFNRAGRLLAMLGRDDAVIELARAVMGDEDAALGSGLASAAALAGVRKGDVRLVSAVWGSLTVAQREDPRVVNPVWQLGEPLLDSMDDARFVRILGRNVRDGRYERDATLAARATARLEGGDAAVSLLAGLMEKAPTEKVRQALAAQMARY